LKFLYFFIIFSYQSGGDGVEIRVQNGTIWLSQRNIGILFDTSADNVGLHLKNIYSEDELSEMATTEDFSVVQKERKSNYAGLFISLTCHFQSSTSFFGDLGIALQPQDNTQRKTLSYCVLVNSIFIRSFFSVIFWSKAHCLSVTKNIESSKISILKRCFSCPIYTPK